jgi:hypothetical protein
LVHASSNGHTRACALNPARENRNATVGTVHHVPSICDLKHIPLSFFDALCLHVLIQRADITTHERALRGDTVVHLVTFDAAKRIEVPVHTAAPICSLITLLSEGAWAACVTDQWRKLVRAAARTPVVLHHASSRALEINIEILPGWESN